MRPLAASILFTNTACGMPNASSRFKIGSAKAALSGSGSTTTIAKSALPNAEKPSAAKPTAPGVSRMCFYVAPGSQWRYRGLESLAGVRLGSINSYSYGQELDTYIRIQRDDPARVQVVSGDQALDMNVEKVVLGRIDATIENAWVMDAYLANSGQRGKLVKAGCRTPDVPIYLAFSPALEASVHHAAVFEAGLKRLRESGRMNALLQRYGLPPLD